MTPSAARVTALEPSAPLDYDILSSEELDTFITFRDNPRCQDTLGNWMRRIAKYAVDKHVKKTS